MIDLAGVGWWKYDVEEAAKLLESIGFVTLTAKWLFARRHSLDHRHQRARRTSRFSRIRLAFAVADSWTKFGVETSVNTMTAGSFWNASSTGEYEAAPTGSCAIGADIYPNVSYWHQRSTSCPRDNRRPATSTGIQ
ncbi:MAG: hypothetical protein R2851_03135 [Caldilineaceae bacterium]